MMNTYQILSLLLMFGGFIIEIIRLILKIIDKYYDDIISSNKNNNKHNKK